MKTDVQYDYERDAQAIAKHKQGVSSFTMQDPQTVFGELKLKEGFHFLDLGCGPILRLQLKS